MKADMSPDAVGGRLNIMGQLWELSSALMNSRSRDGKRASSKRLKAKTIRDSIRLVLMDEWDPIGIRGVPEAVDEYESYIGPIYRLLAEGRSVDEIVEYLRHIESELMAVSTSERIRRRAAVKLLELNAKLERSL